MAMRSDDVTALDCAIDPSGHGSASAQSTSGSPAVTGQGETPIAEPHSCPTIVVLDDEADAAASISQGLTLQRLTAIPFTSDDAVLSATASSRVDAFVLDWCLGARTALGLVRALRNRVATHSTPIFILSGSLSMNGRPLDGQLLAALESFQLHYRAKPISCARLARDIIAAIGSLQTTR